MTTNPCTAHWWVIEPAQPKRESTGLCQRCGEMRKFENFIPTPYGKAYGRPPGAQKGGVPLARLQNRFYAQNYGDIKRAMEQ